MKFRSPTMPEAIVVAAAAIILIIFVLVFAAIYTKQPIWDVLTAIGTLLVAIATFFIVGWAVFQDYIRRKRNRPVLKITPYESDPPYLRIMPSHVYDESPHPATGELEIIDKKWTSYYLTLQLINTGNSIAKSAQAFVTATGSLTDGKWRTQIGWVPVPVPWVFDPPQAEGLPSPSKEKDLVPDRPYLFNLLRVDSLTPDTLSLLWSIKSRNQRDRYDPGEHCFEITAYAVEADPVKTYFRIQWDGGCTDNFQEVKTNIRVFQEGRSPW